MSEKTDAHEATPVATQDVSALCEAVRCASRVCARGASTKLPCAEGTATVLDLTKLSGVIDYQPTEFVIQVWAGTPVRAVQMLLAEHGQYLPFDPLLIEQGATIGGTVAANANGPERYRYGGVRDFIIGVHFIDGEGHHLAGGGKVVKNAAGFDFPKLLVGSRGRLGVITDVTFKVFPKPEAYATLRLTCAHLAEALNMLPKLTNCPYDLNAVDVVAEAERECVELRVRVGGLRGGLAARMDRVRALVGGGEIVSGEDEETLWREAREFTWLPKGACVVKVPLTPARIPALDAQLRGYARRYSVGGTVAWIAAEDIGAIDALLRAQDLPGLVMLRSLQEPRIGARLHNPFAERVKAALDPHNKFGDL